MTKDIQVTDKVKKIIEELSVVCESFQKSNPLNIDSIEENVENLSREVTTLDIAADQNLKGDLLTLNGVLHNLSTTMKETQKNISRQLKEMDTYQRALYAYAHVANNNAC